MTAYAMAKQAMEYLAADWARKYPHIRIAAPRLPRVATDQTATLFPIPAERPEVVLADLMRSFAEQRVAS
jgi:hypothetical protein